MNQDFTAGQTCLDCGDPVLPGDERCAACWEANPRICYHCRKKLDVSPLANIYSDERGEDICDTCYATDVEPFEIWDDDECEVIGYDFTRIVVEDRLALLAVPA